MIPSTSSAVAISEVAIGRRMKGAEMFMCAAAWDRPSASAAETGACRTDTLAPGAASPGLRPPRVVARLHDQTSPSSMSSCLRSIDQRPHDGGAVLDHVGERPLRALVHRDGGQGQRAAQGLQREPHVQQLAGPQVMLGVREAAP